MLKLVRSVVEVQVRKEKDILPVDLVKE